MSSEPSVNLSQGQRSQTPPNQAQSSSGTPGGSGHDRQGGSWSPRGEAESSSQKKHAGLLPAFSSKLYSQLPTPQSPSDLNRFGGGVRFSPESPIPQSQSSYAASGSFSQRLSYRNLQEEASAQPNSSHILTPASSPFIPRNSSFRNEHPATPVNQTSRSMNNPRPSAPTSQFSVESPMLTTPVTPKNQGQNANSSSPPEQSAPSTLSSPFMVKASIPGRASNRPSPQSTPMRVDTVFSPPPAPPLLPPSNISSESSRVPGGEMARIRQAMREDQLSQIREAENRRPDYLKRAKRSLEEADPDAIDEDRRRGEGSVLVGITESPQKGRRIKLFQETSEESFEESLMAGGYGRYRTAEWVRQPQPISLPLGSLPGSSNIVTQLEQVEEKPPTEKELKKQQRLAAFRSNRSEGRPKAKLYPVELEGKGRVLLDIPNEIPPTVGEPEGTPSKRRNTRRKKRNPDPPATDKKFHVDAAVVIAAEDLVEKPNWPDSEFPWRLRLEEREELAKAEEEERLRWIERFLDRDSDDDEPEPEGPPTSNDSESEKEVLPPERWGAVYENASERPALVRMGRGKMVPLLAHPEDPRKTSRIKRSAFPSDPGDAKAALLAKRSVRALSYRQQRRQRELHHDDEEMVLCICRGYDDGRELVQCDGCQTWYHLDCIGIRHIAELGREEDPWYCRRCLTRSRSPSSSPEPELAPVREPTFVPTDDAPRERSVDTPFFQPSIQDSPNWLRVPKTPTRSGRTGTQDSGAYYVTSSSPWPDMSRNPPSTPQGQNHHVRIHTSGNTPGGYDSSRPIFDESPFDPTSTPSRGIRFNASFATPKSQVWPRPTYGFQTPMRGHQRTSNRGSFGGPGSLSAVLDENVSRPYSIHDPVVNKYHPYDESPVRRNRSIDASASRRPFDTPVSTRLLDESPIMRGKGKERSFDHGRVFPL